jgi:hypothetical protein
MINRGKVHRDQQADEGQYSYDKTFKHLKSYIDLPATRFPSALLMDFDQILNLNCRNWHDNVCWLSWDEAIASQSKN